MVPRFSHYNQQGHPLEHAPSFRSNVPKGHVHLRMPRRQGLLFPRQRQTGIDFSGLNTIQFYVAPCPWRR